MQIADDFAQGVEIVPGRFFLVWVKRPDSFRSSQIAASNICYCIDNELLYEPFFADFGPLNLGRTYRFCQRTAELLQEAERHNKRLYCYTGPQAQYKANAAVLVGIYQILFLNRSAEEAYKPLAAYKPYVPFRDASCGVSTFHLTVFDCMKGIQKARDVGLIDWTPGSSNFSLEEYEYYEQVENGDLNWIVPGKLLGFSGPAAKSQEMYGYRLLVPEDYWEYYRRKGVTAVVRLNKKVYDRKRFTDGGFRHYDLYFPDGSCPTEAILLKFLEIVESEPGALAVHCKAGLGRTGVLICSYMMKHYRFTAEEVIGYIRICRPGSVIGPQQNFLREVEQRMWHEGDLYRQAKGGSKMQDMIINGKAAGSYESDASHRTGMFNRMNRPGHSLNGYGTDNLVSQSQVKVYSGIGLSSSPPSPTSTVCATPKGRTSRSMTPMRYSTPTSGALVSAYPPRSTTPVNKSLSSVPLRSPSADRANERAPVTALRATLHTETLSAANRPKIIPERNAQSADISSTGWKITTAAGVATPSAAATRSSGVARVLAPNGQPRKVPAYMLNQYSMAGGKTTSQRVVPSSIPDSKQRSSAANRYSSFLGYGK